MNRLSNSKKLKKKRGRENPSCLRGETGKKKGGGGGGRGAEKAK